MKQRVLALAVVTTLFVTGCGLFSRSKSRFYTLERIPPAGAVAQASGLPVGIDSLEMPPGFDRRDILVRKPDLQLDVRGTEQWSASLEPMVLHTLAFDLASRLPEGMVILPGQVRPAGAMRGIDVVVEELSAGPENVATLNARLVLREGRAERTWHERITIDLTSLDSAQVAAGYSRAVATLADRIAARLGAP
jgi:uncharacterized lipoprotein YmbA